MINRSLEKDIIIRKKLLNFLLKFFSPRNRLILYLSQNLDRLVYTRQKILYINHIKNESTPNCLTISKDLKRLKKIA
ncbi:hypothetical protein SAMN04488529_101374 [Clostridium gasigenes]|uniref:Uncharacterized protein n=1 Tax=Clostridium gasigenes TaxID=94869 RepID=A0A1H0M9I8_9CLOT|nr:hypothetical protein SAMN04488529_101374 [Clostridium gasigenes]